VVADPGLCPQGRALPLCFVKHRKKDPFCGRPALRTFVLRRALQPPIKGADRPGDDGATYSLFHHLLSPAYRAMYPSWKANL